MYFSVLLFILILNESTSTVNSTLGRQHKLQDSASITISLKNYNATLPEGESLDSFHVLPPYSVTEVLITNISPDVYYVVMQAHSYLVNVTLSQDDVPVQNNSITGTNVGLLKITRQTDLSFYLTYNSSLEDVDVMLSVQAYPKTAPILGGCNMEFQVEVSPFLVTTYNEAVTEVRYALSSPPISALPDPVVASNGECNLKPSPIQYEMFHQYFPERDFTKNTYFNILRSMMTIGRIRENGVSVPEKLQSSSVKRIFATYPGTGNAFAVVSRFENNVAVYVPSFTYGCSDLKENNTCIVLTSTFSKLLCATVLFMGLFACFFGHYFFRIEIFLFGFLTSSVISYILISILFSKEIALSSSVSIGLLTAAFMLISWTVFGLPIISIVLTTLTFGFLLASIVYYPLVDYVDLMVLDINFWGIFIGIVITCPVLMIYLAEKANIISCAFLGSYVGIMSIDHYIGSNLRYIVINNIRRAVVPQFKWAITDPPFQLKDGLLCLVWAFLMITGIIVQKKLMKNKPPYPPPVNPFNKCFKKLKKLPVADNTTSERTPLFMGLPSNAASGYNSPTYAQYEGNRNFEFQNS